MDWSFDKNRARTKGTWLFEPARALGTVAKAKVPRGSGGFPK